MQLTMVTDRFFFRSFEPKADRLDPLLLWVWVDLSWFPKIFQHLENVFKKTWPKYGQRNILSIQKCICFMCLFLLKVHFMYIFLNVIILEVLLRKNMFLTPYFALLLCAGPLIIHFIVFYCSLFHLTRAHAVIVLFPRVFSDLFPV